ncbi:MAG: hypothetical protein AABW91_01595 [Nanoarchaeota archaeon]
MAKRKLKKAKKTSRKVGVSKERNFGNNIYLKIGSERERVFTFLGLFLNLLFIAIIILGIVVGWAKNDWLQGIGIIFAALFIYLLIKLISNLRKK